MPKVKRHNMSAFATHPRPAAIGRRADKGTSTATCKLRTTDMLKEHEMSPYFENPVLEVCGCQRAAARVRLHNAQTHSVGLQLRLCQSLISRSCAYIKKLKNGLNMFAVKSEDMYKQFAVPSVLATLSKLHLELS